MIGYLVSNISNNYFTQVASYLEAVVNAENYNIMFFSSDQRKDKELSYLEMLIENKVDGLVINTSGYNDGFIAEMSRNIPVVSINRRIRHEHFVGDFIDSDNINGVYMLTEYLVSLGHNRIGVINGDQNLSTDRKSVV